MLSSVSNVYNKGQKSKRHVMISINFIWSIGVPSSPGHDINVNHIESVLQVAMLFKYFQIQSFFLSNYSPPRNLRWWSMCSGKLGIQHQKYHTCVNDMCFFKPSLWHLLPLIPLFTHGLCNNGMRCMSNYVLVLQQLIQHMQIYNLMCAN